MMPEEVAAFQLYVCLRSVDPARNRARSYTLLWQPGLFGDGALIRAWCRTGRPEPAGAVP